MADRFAEAVLEIRTDLSDTQKQLEALKNKLEDTGKSTKNLSQLFSLDMITRWGKSGLDAVLKVGEGIAQLGIRGAAVGDVAGSFDVLSQKAGQSADVLLGKMRDGVKGTIDDTNLMTMANKALGAGLVKSADDMATLAAGARSLGKTTGTDTKTAFETLTQAIASGRTAQLKQLGLFVDSKVAVEAYAKQHGIAVGELTDFQRAQALSASAMAALKQRMGEIKPDVADFGELIEAGKAKLTNLTDQLAVGISNSPVLRAGMLALGQAIEQGFGKGQDVVGVLIEIVNKLAIGLTYAADLAIGAARFIVVGFTEAKMVLLGALSVLSGGLASVAGFLATIAEKASDLPVVGEKFKEIQGSLAGLQQTAASYSEAFQQETNASMVLIDQENAMFDRLGGVVDKSRNAMLAMGQAHAEAAVTAQEAAPAIAGDQLPLMSEANSRKLEDINRTLEAQLAAIGLTGIDQRKAQLKAEYDAKVAQIQALTSVDVTDKETALVRAQEYYTRQLEIAQLGSDQIRDTKLALEQTIALAETTGLEQRLMQLDFAQQAEIRGLANLKVHYSDDYNQLVTLIQQKYAQMTEAAKGHFGNVQQAASAAGFKTQAELQHTADVALQTYNAMKASQLYSVKTMQAAWEAAEKAKQEATKATNTFSVESTMEMASQTVGILKELFGKSKAVAIAEVIVRTAMAVMGALTQLPSPKAYVDAALAVAMGAAQIVKISSAKSGFAEGTPNLDYMRFPKEYPTTLHNTEAVIPQGGGHLLAGEIADAMGDQVPAGAAGGGASSSAMPQSFTGTVFLEGKKVGEALFELSKTGAFRVHSMALVTT